MRAEPRKLLRAIPGAELCELPNAHLCCGSAGTYNFDQPETGNLETTHLLRDAGRAIGSVLATCIAILNPEVIVLGGEIAEIGEPVIAGVRESVYRRALPMASQHLQVVQASASGLEGVIGAAHLVLAQVLDPEAVEQTLSTLAAVGD